MVQCVRQLGSPLDTPTGALRYSGHNFWATVPRVRQSTCGESSCMAVGAPCRLEIRAALSVGPVSVAGSLTGWRSWQPKQSKHSCRLHARFLGFEIFLYQHSLGERHSSKAGVLGRPPVRKVLERPDNRWFRTPSHGEMLVIIELSVTADAFRPPSCPPAMTDLAGLREKSWHAQWQPLGVGGHKLASPQPAWEAGSQTMLRKALRSVFIIVLLFFF